MSEDTTMHFFERLQMIIEQDMLIEQVSNKSKVPNPIVRLIVAEVGASLPKVYRRLYELGHAVPLTDFSKGSNKLNNGKSAMPPSLKVTLETVN